MFKNILKIACIMILITNVCFAESVKKFSVSGEIGYFSPGGEWTSHRYAPGTDQFRGGYTVAPEFEFKINDIGIGVIYAYTKLGTSEWEDFVRSQGEDLYASGSMGQLAGVIRYYVLDAEQHSIDIEAGMSYVFLKGNEEYRGYDYEYDYLQSGIGFTGGVGYQFAVNERLSVVLPVRVLWKPEGIKYLEGRTYDIFGAFFLPGLKLTF